MAKVISCVCGASVQGETEDQVLDKAEEHVKTEHADQADQFPREKLATLVRDA
ncbi:MAG TPA: DUF1059 domain-containing protein [Actinomycetota bacterium]|nr:DUF1059 domain-containing protein [Actinomycetota bacterium]